MHNNISLGLHKIANHLRNFARYYPRSMYLVLPVLLLCGTGATFAVSDSVGDNRNQDFQHLTESVFELANMADAAQWQQPFYRSDLTRTSDTIESLLRRLDVQDPEAANFLRTDVLAAQALWGHAGRSVRVQTNEQHALLQLQLRWSPLDDGMFQRLTVEKTADGWQSKQEGLPLGVRTQLASGTISSTLFAATDAAGILDAVALQLGEIFSSKIEFHRALQKGDHFSLVYETLEGDGEPLRSGRILSAEFTNLGKTYQAMWFQEPHPSEAANTTMATHSLTKSGYYTLEGQNLQHTYLTSPLEFSRISSGFEMRQHPILKTWIAHLGVDYAASTGTPVRTVADGVVEFAGVQNGYGNMVVVKHPNNHSTVYAHLSQIQVATGQNVQQGNYVGQVGATGWATGPHLHFEFRVNGVHRDPLSLIRQSEPVSIAAAYKPLFDDAAKKVRLSLSCASELRLSSVE